MRKYEVFHYIHEPLCDVDIPISVGFVFMSGKREEDAIQFPDESVWGYSYVPEVTKW